MSLHQWLSVERVLWLCSSQTNHHHRHHFSQRK
jgi:hypothetical protein